MTDRSQAISLVEAALQAGRIVQADHDMRLDQIERAVSDQEIDLVVRDLQPRAAVAATPTMTAGTPPATSQQPWPLVNYGPSQGQPVELTAVGSNAGKKIGGVIALVVALAVIVPIAAVIIGLVSARDTFEEINFGEPVDETTYLPGQAPGENGVNVHSVDGFADLVGALEEETGTTRVFSAVLYPRYAVLYVPEQATGKRYAYYYWDGRSLEPNDSKSTSDNPRIDLAAVNSQVMVDLLEDVRSRVEDPDTWYVSIDADPTTKDPRFSVHASNEYGEGAYVLATLDGEITYENTYE